MGALVLREGLSPSSYGLSGPPLPMALVLVEWSPSIYF